MRSILIWLSRRAFEGRLDARSLENVSKIIQEHFPILQPLLPLTITIKSTDGLAWKVNNILLGASSPFERAFDQ